MQIARPVGRAIFLRLHSLVFCMQNTRLHSLVFCMQNTIVLSARGGSLYFWYAHNLK